MAKQTKKQIDRKMKMAATMARKWDLVRCLSERLWFAAAFDRSGRRKAEVKAMEKRLARMSEDDIKAAADEISRNRLHARYGKGCLQERLDKDARDQMKLERAQAAEDEREYVARQIQKAQETSKRVMRKRPKQVTGQVYTLAYIKQTVPKLKDRWTHKVPTQVG